MSESVKTVIVGAGQSGLALSYYLSQLGQEHVILDMASQPADAWRNQRWDSFTLVTPNWSFRLPGANYQDGDPHGYMKRDEIVRRFEDYIQRFHLPVTYNTPVTGIEPRADGSYSVRTPSGQYKTRNVIIANGFFQNGKIPDFAAHIPAPLLQMHSARYRNPGALPEGSVLVVGSGQSGMQIAEELYQSGRKVFLSTSGAPRAPRRYRGKDLVEWLYLSGFFDHTLDTFPFTNNRKFVPPTVTGKDGGHTLNLHQFYRDGVTLLGRVQGYQDGSLILSEDLQTNLAKSDMAEKMMLKNIDSFIQRAGFDVPTAEVPTLTDAYSAPDLPALDLRAEKISTIIWASGYRYTCPIVPMSVLDDYGLPLTRHWQSSYPGLYFLGIPFISKLKSGFLFGIAEDAQHMAEHIAARG